METKKYNLLGSIFFVLIERLLSKTGRYQVQVVNVSTTHAKKKGKVNPALSQFDEDVTLTWRVFITTRGSDGRRIICRFNLTVRIQRIKSLEQHDGRAKDEVAFDSSIRDLLGIHEWGLTWATQAREAGSRYVERRRLPGL